MQARCLIANEAIDALRWCSRRDEKALGGAVSLPVPRSRGSRDMYRSTSAQQPGGPQAVPRQSTRPSSPASLGPSPPSHDARVPESNRRHGPQAVEQRWRGLACRRRLRRQTPKSLSRPQVWSSSIRAGWQTVARPPDWPIRCAYAGVGGARCTSRANGRPRHLRPPLRPETWSSSIE
ncbi:hypothetical protein IQ07DRAFT_350635 [Pyrenochaeta sp. DS3sAY3a]|nr:hypothetical protein IQ07DRAFT_350635 [Pyrenochaeta sp. DS3sAY3a]